MNTPAPSSLPEAGASSASSEASRGTQADIVVNNVSKWFGDVMAVSQVTCEIRPGVTALLGPNGSGKTSLLKMMTGLALPSSGEIVIAGRSVRQDTSAYRLIGAVLEQETIYPFLTGFEFVRMNAAMQQLPDIEDATWRAIDLLELRDAANRGIGGYSKGMRQRIKIAAALVHDPRIILMDEPLSGTDPRQRARIIDLIRRLGAEGRTVLVSSHVLGEVQRFAQRIVVIVNGRLAAEGDYRAIRDKIDEHARRVHVRCSDPRRLAGALFSQESVSGVFLNGHDHDDLIIETSDGRRIYQTVPVVAKEFGVRLYEIRPLDDSLASVFSYVTERR
jgi:ABC-2 type transport system ATP-binding protein